MEKKIQLTETEKCLNRLVAYDENFQRLVQSCNKK